MRAWGSLADFLTQGRLTIPDNKRLISELENLKLEEMSRGSKWRVTDSTKRIHRDVSMSLAMACLAAMERTRWGDDWREDDEEQIEFFDAFRPSQTIDALDNSIHLAELTNDKLEYEIRNIRRERKLEDGRVPIHQFGG